MDGSSSTFLFDTPWSSAPLSAPLGGILYVEDFDDEPSAEPVAVQETAQPSFTAEEVAAAREAGRQDGLQTALADAQLVQAQLHASALQSVIDGLAAARATLVALTEAHAYELSQTMLAMLLAAVPATMHKHALGEARAMIDALLPGLACEPELRVRVHPALADEVREMLVTALPADTCVLAVCADESLPRGDVHVAWQHGRARRDCAAIWSQVTTALDSLRLPTLEEVCDGCAF